jgi:5-methylcytosine-specific restriction enzyme A
MQRVERLRGRAGQRQRKRRLARTNGLCERCLDRGFSRTADVVDHIKPLAKGGSDQDSNTRNLCDDCHDAVTAEQFGFASAEKGVDVNGRPTLANHPWNATSPGGGSKL